MLRHTTQVVTATLLLLAALALMTLALPAKAAGTFVGDMTPTATAKVIGHGCTTVFFIDTDCDGCGIGVYQAATFTPITNVTPGNQPTGYQVVQNPPSQTTAPFYTVSDTMDADDQDSQVCTTTDWQNKWGWTLPDVAADNTVMQTFLSQRKGFTNTSRIFYLDQRGNDATAAANHPEKPFLTYGAILGTTKDFQGGGIIIRGAQLTGSGSVAAQNVAVSCTGVPTTAGCTLSSAWAGPSSLVNSGGVGLALGFTVQLSGGLVIKGVSVKNGSAAVSWQNPGSIPGGTTTAITVNYGILTVTTPPATPNLRPGEKIVMAGLPVSSFIVSLGAGTTGGNGTYIIADPALTITSTVLESFSANWGMSLDFNAGTTNFLNPNFNMAGSSGHQLYVMNYPGEIVESDIGWFPTAGTSPGKGNQGYLTIDGLKWWSLEYGALGGPNAEPIQFYYGKNFTLMNSEFAGHNHIETAFSSEVKFIHNVFHDSADHAIYVSFGAGACPTEFSNEMLASGDFDFNLDRNNAAPTGYTVSCGASYHTQIIENISYDGCPNGLDCIHVNSWADDPVVTGNIISYTGGVSIQLATGIYNGRVSGNLSFGNSSYCYYVWVNSVGADPTGMQAGTDRWNDEINNVCWLSQGSDTIQGKGPQGALLVGICFPGGQNSCANIVHKPNVWAKDTYIAGNVYVTSDTNIDLGQTAFQFAAFSYPDTATKALNNTIWSIGPLNAYGSAGRANLDPSAFSAGSPAAITTYVCSGGSPVCNYPSINAGWTGNIYQNPNFPTASQATMPNIGQFDFGKFNLH